MLYPVTKWFIPGQERNGDLMHSLLLSKICHLPGCPLSSGDGREAAARAGLAGADGGGWRALLAGRPGEGSPGPWWGERGACLPSLHLKDSMH